MVENFKDVSYSDRLCIIVMPTLQFRRLRTDMIQAYKIFHGYDDIDTECFFTVDSDSYTRGHPLKLKKTRGNMVRHISIFSYRTVNDWNSLPSYVVMSVNCFNNNNNGYIIMVIFKCYFSGEHIALSINKKNNGANIELGKTNGLKAQCMKQINS